jgi:TRAP-type C4-dicarboxylate transport system permease large subunit
MNALSRFRPAILATGLGIVALYVFALMLGAFGPSELPAISVVVALVLVMFAVHAMRLRRELREPNAPGHDELMRSLHKLRERRGF